MFIDSTADLVVRMPHCFLSHADRHAHTASSALASCLPCAREHAVRHPCVLMSTRRNNWSRCLLMQVRHDHYCNANSNRMRLGTKLLVNGKYTAAKGQWHTTLLRCNRRVFGQRAHALRFCVLRRTCTHTPSGREWLPMVTDAHACTKSGANAATQLAVIWNPVLFLCHDMIIFW